MKCVVHKLLILGLLLMPATLFAQSAGVVELAEGRVFIIDDKRKMSAIKKDDEIQAGQTIVTGEQAELHIRMADGAFVAVRPNSQLLIEEYRANGDENDAAIFNLVKGAFRSVTGWIGQRNKKNYKIQTPTATIGVRGTDHETFLVERNAAARKLFGEPGTYDKVNDGATVMRGAAGKEIALLKGEAGFVGFGKAAPKKLETVPDFFKPGKNDSLIEQHKKAQQNLIQQRLQQIRKPGVTPQQPAVKPRPVQPVMPGKAAGDGSVRTPKPANVPGDGSVKSAAPVKPVAPSLQDSRVIKPQSINNNVVTPKTELQKTPLQPTPAVPVSPQLQPQSLSPGTQLPAVQQPPLQTPQTTLPAVQQPTAQQLKQVTPQQQNTTITNKEVLLKDGSLLNATKGDEAVKQTEPAMQLKR